MQNNDGQVEAQQEVEAIESEVEALEGDTEETKDSTDWKAKYEETAGRLKRAETKLEKSKIDKKVEEKIQQKTNTGELDETQLDYLDLKGITDDEEIEVIQKVMQKTGQTVRQALKDDYVQSRLTKLREARELKEATPGNTKRSGAGSGGTDVGTALAKYEATGELPGDFKLRTAVVNAKIAKDNTNKPAWH